MAAVVVVFDGGISVRWRSMASAMDHDERTRGWHKPASTMRGREGGATRGWQEMMVVRQPELQVVSDVVQKDL